MRAPLLALLIALSGCPQGVGERGLASEDGAGSGSGSGTGQGLAPNCNRDADCIVAAPKCCDCPTHAVPANDPAQNACLDVQCGPMSCGSPMQAACNAGYCTLECVAVACDASACPNGFATDGNGCLTCECAGIADVGSECTGDSDCARVRDDCCGCANGGSDTSVPTGQVASHEAMLACPATPTCPGGNSCASDLAARCVQGYCGLVAGALPANACGRADLPACAAGEACYVNASDPATMRGVGICQP